MAESSDITRLRRLLNRAADADPWFGEILDETARPEQISLTGNTVIPEGEPDAGEVLAECDRLIRSIRGGDRG